MKKLNKIKILIILICISTFIIPAKIVYSTNDSVITAPITTSNAALLMDTDTGIILYNKNAFEKMYPASTTKVMTAILVLEKTNLEDKVTISHNAIFSVPYTYSSAYLQEGETFTVKELLYALLIPSANDAAFALAEHVGGSVENFSSMMNEKAKEIGCKNTNFINPNGIFSEDHYSTAYDLALITNYAMKFDTFKKIVQTDEFTLPQTELYTGEERKFKNTNYLLQPNIEGITNPYYYENTTGGKTGYTDKSGHCIVLTASKNNINLTCIILGGFIDENNIRSRETDAINLFEYGFNNYSKQTIAKKNETYKTISVPKASLRTKNLELILKEDISPLVLNNYSIENSNPNIVLKEHIEAPIETGEELGTITYNINGNDYTGKLIAKNKVLPFPYWKIPVYIIIGLFLLSSINKKKKRRIKKSTKKKIKKAKKNLKRNK